MTGIPLSEEIQALIIAVQKYKAFVIADWIARRKDKKCSFDWYAMVWGYFTSLSFPAELKHSKRCFENMLEYPVNDTLNTPANQLEDNFLFWF